MNSNLEKAFMIWCFEHPELFNKIHASFFENDILKDIYKIVKKEYKTHNYVPTFKETVELVKMKDKKGELTDDILKKILTKDKGLSDEFIKLKLESWVLYNATTLTLMENLELFSTIDKTDNDAIKEATQKAKRNLVEKTAFSINENMGLDFFDVFAHDQETHLNKISTGYRCLDKFMEGGWDRKTLNLIICRSGGGKSVWMQNMAINVLKQGYNVVYVSLELADKKVMKRLGSIGLRIPIRDYDKLSKDRDYMAQKINDFKDRPSLDPFEKTKSGRLFVAEFPASTATNTDIEAYLKNLEEIHDFKIDFLVVDYIQIMKAEYGNGTLYENGKFNSEGLRDIAKRMNLVALTATQIGKDKYDTNDLFLSDISESKGFVDASDTIWGSIRNDIMTQKGIVHFKRLKIREDNSEESGTYDRIEFKFEREFITYKEVDFVPMIEQ